MDRQLRNHKRVQQFRSRKPVRHKRPVHNHDYKNDQAGQSQPERCCRQPETVPTTQGRSRDASVNSPWTEETSNRGRRIRDQPQANGPKAYLGGRPSGRPAVSGRTNATGTPQGALPNHIVYLLRRFSLFRKLSLMEPVYLVRFSCLVRRIRKTLFLAHHDNSIDPFNRYALRCPTRPPDDHFVNLLELS